MKTSKGKFFERIAQLGLSNNDAFNGRFSTVKNDGIHLLEIQPNVPGFIPYEKTFPHLNELAKMDKFIAACIRHFTSDHEDEFMIKLCKWLSGDSTECPVYDFDLFYIPGNFHSKIVYFSDDDKMSREELIEAINAKFKNGFVLDASKMKSDRIVYFNGEYDSIKGEWLPCLVDNDGEVAVDYFEAKEPIPLNELVGLKSNSKYSV